MAEPLTPTGEYESERRTYPWGEWLDGRPWRLTMDYPDKPGDFVSEPATFRPYIYTVAKNRGLKVVVSIDGDDLILQAYEPGTRRPTLPTRRATLRNGRPDPHAEDAAPRTSQAARRTCRHCGKGLSSFAATQGDECRKVQDLAWRCTDAE